MLNNSGDVLIEIKFKIGDKIYKIISPSSNLSEISSEEYPEESFLFNLKKIGERIIYEMKKMGFQPGKIFHNKNTKSICDLNGIEIKLISVDD